MTTTQQTTVAELRAKTDRELAALIGRQLDFAVACLRSTFHCAEAEKIYLLAGKIIPLIEQIPVQRRNHLESLLRNLGALLAEKPRETSLLRLFKRRLVPARHF